MRIARRWCVRGGRSRRWGSGGARWRARPWCFWRRRGASPGRGGGGGGGVWGLRGGDGGGGGLCGGEVRVVVDCERGERGVGGWERVGGVVVGRELVRGFVGVAEKRWKEVKAAMK